MPLTQIEVEHIANLARLELSAEEIKRFGEQLSDILEYASRLQAVETGDILPTSSVLPPRSVLRPDRAEESLPLKEVLRNAPDSEAEQFRVPPVFE